MGILSFILYLVQLLWFLASTALAASAVRGSPHERDASVPLWSYVDPLIGTVGSTPGSAIAGGNSFPGSSLPWSMAKPGIDTSYLGIPNGTAVDCNAGYSPLGNVTGISLTHVSGTGGAPTYGLISQMPLSGSLQGINLADNQTYWQNRTLDNETSTVGLFTTTLLNGITLEITSSNHSAYMRYTFPSTNPSGTANASTSGLTDLSDTDDDVGSVLVDLTHVLPAYSSPAYSQKFLNGDLHIRNTASGPSYYGSATYTGGWVQPNTHTLFFCGNFSVPSSSSLQPSSLFVSQDTMSSVPGAGTFSWQYNPNTPLPMSSAPALESYQDLTAYAGSGMGIGALFSWELTGANASAGSVLEAKVGISYISAEQACSHVSSELPSELSFVNVVQQARDEWESKVLTKIQVVDDESETSTNNTLKRMLYTALYGTALMPTDKTGENPYWMTSETSPYFDDFYTLWDIYRTLMPLYHLLYTQTYSRIISGLISVFTNEGFLPAGRAANWNGRVQGGTHADMVLTDAFVKSVRSPSGQIGRGELGTAINWQKAYKAIVNDANTIPIHNVDSVAFDGSTKEGRGALDDYLALHYITRNHTRSISRGVEYSQNDYAAWSMAVGLNESAADVESYRDRADWWQNQWNPYANTSLARVGNFTGFPGARNADGGWNFTAYDPLSCGGCGWGDDLYEAKVWETSFAAAPHDMSTLIKLMGGDEAFVKRLDASFLPGFGTSVGANNDAGSALFNPGNEPSFMTPFLYNYVPGQQWKTANQTRATVDSFYGDGRDGYPGNIDGGALPSWLIFNLIGLYPVAAQPVYLLGSPRFSALNISLFSSTLQATSLQIRANNLSNTSYYPQTVTWNGQVLNRSWLSHAEVSGGGELVFNMGEQPGSWDSGERPPSLSGW